MEDEVDNVVDERERGNESKDSNMPEVDHDHDTKMIKDERESVSEGQVHTKIKTSAECLRQKYS